MFDPQRHGTLDASPNSGHEEPRAACVTLVGTILELEMEACGMMCWVSDCLEFPRGVRRRADAHVCHTAFTAHQINHRLWNFLALAGDEHYFLTTALLPLLVQSHSWIWFICLSLKLW